MAKRLQNETRQALPVSFRSGADNGRRTRLCSLGSCRSTDELYPHIKLLNYYSRSFCKLQHEKCRRPAQRRKTFLCGPPRGTAAKRSAQLFRKNFPETLTFSRRMVKYFFNEGVATRGTPRAASQHTGRSRPGLLSIARLMYRRYYTWSLFF